MAEDINALLDRLGGTAPPVQAPTQAPTQPTYARRPIDPRKAQMILTALLPLAAKQGGRVAVTGLLHGYQQAMAQSDAYQRQGMLDQERSGQLAWTRQVQQGQLDRQNAAEDRMAAAAQAAEADRRLGLQQAFLNHVGQTMGREDLTPEEASAQLQAFGQMAPNYGLQTSQVQAFAPPTSRLERNRLKKILGQVDTAYKDRMAPEDIDKLVPDGADGQTVGQIRARLSGLPQTPTGAPKTPKKQVWVTRGGQTVPIEEGTAQPGDVPYQPPPRTRGGSGGGDGSSIDRLADAVAMGADIKNFTPTQRAAIVDNMQRRGLKTPTTSPYQEERQTRNLDSVNELLGKVSNWTTGAGSMLAGIPGSDARNFKAQLDTLKANIAFGELTAMRAASKTGGALGAVSDREGQLLQSALGALDTGQSPAEFKNQLLKIKGSIERWQAASSGGTTTPPPANPNQGRKIGRFTVVEEQ